MSQESRIDDAITPGELSELLAKVEGTTVEEVERGTAESVEEMAPPWEATIVKR